ncbi:MAG: cysteine-rich CWC family protein [Halarcobacter sp.]
MIANPKICPICKKENKCEAHIPNNDCWCNHIKVPAKLREFIPEEFKMKACICKDCVELFIKDEDSFIKRYFKYL